RERLAARRWEVPTVVCGFVTDMHRWMAAADVVVTKAGPSTVAEALALGKPVLLYGAVPGQEEGNITYVVASGAGAYTPELEVLVSTLREWLRPGNPIVEEMAQRACQVGRADAALRVAQEVGRLLEGRKGEPPTIPHGAPEDALSEADREG
ncbi:MAG: glycosyltransferase, partial [Anaerolineae bacterium]